VFGAQVNFGLVTYASYPISGNPFFNLKLSHGGLTSGKNAWSTGAPNDSSIEFVQEGGTPNPSPVYCAVVRMKSQ
jgi:hypothetical protein